MNSISRWFVLLVISSALALMACADEVVREVPVEKIVTQEVVKEVPVEKIVEVEKTVVETVEVEKPVEVIKEVVKEVEVPGETVVVEVEKEVVRTVEVEVEVPVEKVVEVEKEVVRTVEVDRIVVVTPAPLPTPVKVVRPAPQPKTKAGEVRFATNYVPDSGGGRNAFYGGPYSSRTTCEDLFTVNLQGERIGKLAKSWTLHDDYLGATVDIQENVPFHSFEGQNFGNVTAADVVWSINDANPHTNPQSATDGSGNLGAFLGSNMQVAVDEDTVELSWANFLPQWQQAFFGEDGLQECILSKGALDQLGADWYVDHTAGSGPFKLLEWVRGDRYVFEAVPDHWWKAPAYDRMTWEQTPDPTVKQAALEAGSADVSDVPTSQSLDLQEAGFKTVPTNAGAAYGLWFSGNLWEETHAKTGEVLERNTYVHDLPWIGNPYKPDDNNNPPGIDDMEQARLVREAIAFAIDRDLLNEEILGGVGLPIHQLLFDPRDPNWDDKWAFGYDPAYAEELLDKAGYPRGSDGIRFEMPMYGWNYGRATRAALSDAVGGMLRDIGIDVPVNHYAYEVWRPGVVTRSAVEPWLDGWSALMPYDWPRAIQCSSLSRGGKSRGVEAPQCSEANLMASAERDYDKRIEINRKFADFMREQALAPGVVILRSAWTYNPNKIGAWTYPMGFRGAINPWAHIELK